ncbi:MAG: DUF58 domain-containing protein [Clostridia bacterium]|nr:DUF58 domain-containing protein [Clostridia bacterium]
MLVFVLVLIAVAAAMQYWSLAHALDGVEHHYAPDRKLTEPGERFFLVNRVTNRSFRFVPYIEVSQLLPEAMEVEGTATEAAAGNGKTLRYSLYLMPRQTWEQRVPVSVNRRGRYAFTSATLQGGGFLGTGELIAYSEQFEELVVMPAPCTAVGLDDTLGGFLGDRSVDRFILEDPVLTLGFREYTGREPMKAISWTQSARSGQLMVKKYDYTLELTATVLLNVECTRTKGWEERLEACFSLARTVCETLEEKRIPYRFVTNAGAAGAVSLWSQVSDGMGAGHLTTILEGLGRATYEPLRPFAHTLEQCARHAEQGRTHILITPQRDDRWLQSLSRLEQLSGSRALILTAEEAMTP